jgi:hypothetical protein
MVFMVFIAWLDCGLQVVEKEELRSLLLKRKEIICPVFCAELAARSANKKTCAPSSGKLS